ncbi:hypothetical protein GCM10023084_59320 [Streptomyces lacrimifluminis]|uniref:DUF3800 domain-containing protein n=1 Tax=Streptomyces lacrimifluminis TaxID=1500077 RepID=A0A917P3N7_9ACTN|nr:hypothetical protein [Streptomyces lacrimifluminis]GGJ56725.1 hypothetical protein GCM10012282_62270 [Streptomyces lacrimifluminis]
MSRQYTEVEIACDESGSDGENLTGGNTDVFAHAGVDVPMESATAAVQEIRDRIRSPAEEYKANHLLREKHRAVLEWLLAPSGPLHGHAHVHLTEKTFFMVERVLDLLLGDPAGAVPLCRAGADAFGAERWKEFLAATNALLRVRGDTAGAPGAPVDAFFRAVDALARQAPELHDPAAADVLQRLGGARSRAADHRARLLSTPALIPVLNPLLPAIVRTAASWHADGRTVVLVHDRQNMLTEERIEWLKGTTRIAGLRLVVARDDTRVQLADFLAGIARSIASHELNGRGDATLTALLRPYVNTRSVWGDERSRGQLFEAVHN